MIGDPPGDSFGIPTILHSAATGAPFTQCVECGHDLSQGELPYAVEKVLRDGEVVFEYAICAQCIGDMLAEYSAESLERLQRLATPDLMQRRGQIENRIAAAEAQRHAALLGIDSEQHPEEWKALAEAIGLARGLAGEGLPKPPPPRTTLQACAKCGRPADDDRLSNEHTVMGLFVGSQLVDDVLVCCAACGEGITEDLSRQTRDSHGDFVDRNFPGVPDTMDLPVASFAG